MALYFECRINKIALLQTVFLVILLTGIKLSLDCGVLRKQLVDDSQWEKLPKSSL